MAMMNEGVIWDPGADLVVASQEIKNKDDDDIVIQIMSCDKE